MEFIDLAKSRYSVRSFKDEQISDDIINKILEAAKVAPSACNNQPIKIFVISSNEGKEKVKKSTNCHFNAPLFMLVCYDNNLCWNRPFDNKSSGDVDASIVTTHIILEAHSLGIGSTWVMFFDPFIISKELELPNNIVPVSLIPMGYPSNDCVPSAKHTTYRDMNEVVVKI